jgi:hypothetical protein
MQNIFMAATRDEAMAAFSRFIVTYGAKYPKATDNLI